MSLYNLINGVNPATFAILPMLGKHPDEYPRFRDCFVVDGMIAVYTRVGGGNRESYHEDIEKLRAMPGYIRDEDDDFDSTYATFYFAVPLRWKEDFDRLGSGKGMELSEEYRQEMCRVFPKLQEKLMAALATIPNNIDDRQGHE